MQLKTNYFVKRKNSSIEEVSFWRSLVKMKAPVGAVAGRLPRAFLRETSGR